MERPAPPRKTRKRCRRCAELRIKCSSPPCSKCFAMCARCEPQGLAAGQLFIDLVLSNAKPHTLAAPFLEAFRQMKLEGEADRQRALVFLRTWRAMSLRIGTDITHGLAAAIRERFRISPVELEGVKEEQRVDRRSSALPPPPSSTALGPMKACDGGGKGSSACPSAAGRAEGGGGVRDDDHVAIAQRLAQTNTFKMLDDGTSMCMAVLPLPTGVVVCANEMSSQLWCSAEEAYGYMCTHKMIVPYMTSSMCAPEDRPVWAEMLLTVMFSASPKTAPAFVKFCSRDGDIDVLILRCRQVTFPEFPQYPACVMTLEKAPFSRHITRRPDQRHRLVGCFMKTDSAHGPPPECTEKIGSPQQPSGAPFPGMASLPLPPLIDTDITSYIRAPADMLSSASGGDINELIADADPTAALLNGTTTTPTATTTVDRAASHTHTTTSTSAGSGRTSGTSVPITTTAITPTTTIIHPISSSAAAAARGGMEGVDEGERTSGRMLRKRDRASMAVDLEIRGGGSNIDVKRFMALQAQHPRSQIHAQLLSAACHGGGGVVGGMRRGGANAHRHGHAHSGGALGGLDVKEGDIESELLELLEEDGWQESGGMVEMVCRSEP